MSANATVRGARHAVLESPLGDFAGWRLAVDCGTSDCRRDRAYDLGELARVLGSRITMGAVLRQLRCQTCGARPDSVFLEAGDEMQARGHARRVALTGPEERVRPDWP
jgi:hypothetical protein